VWSGLGLVSARIAVYEWLLQRREYFAYLIVFRSPCKTRRLHTPLEKYSPEVEMARQTGYTVLGLAAVLFGVLILVPMLKRMFPQYYEPFINPRCTKTTCPEGSFCLKQANPNQGADAEGEEVCVPIGPNP
jgi:hypothetical protein